MAGTSAYPAYILPKKKNGVYSIIKRMLMVVTYISGSLAYRYMLALDIRCPQRALPLSL